MKIILYILIFSVFPFCAFAQGGIKQYSFKVDESYNHDITAYTQGLFVHNGAMYETTGQYGESSLRRVDIKSGKVISYVPFAHKYFVEGSCVLDGRIYILTWMEHVCFVYDLTTFRKIGEFRNPYQGWGLTTDGKSLIMSDGSSTIYYLDPMTFMEQRKIEVKMGSRSVEYINELEYINGEIWANVYTTDNILIINPSTGNVTGRIDCGNLLPASLRGRNTDVLNGIAWDSKKEYIYLTGKLWPKLYRISLIEKQVGRKAK